MTTERSSFEESGTDTGAMGDDALNNADAIVGTREDEMTSTGLSDSPYAGSTSERDWTSSSASSSGDRLQDAAGGVAERVADTAQQQIGTRANTQLARAGDVLDQVAKAVRQSGEQLRQDQPQIAGFADTAASQVDRASQFFRQTDFNGLVREGENFARRQPALFLGGALLLGVVASRFLKASPQGGQSGQSGRGYGSGYTGSSYGRSSYGAGSFGGGSAYDGSSYGGGSYAGTSYGAAASAPGASYGTPYGATGISSTGMTGTGDTGMTPDADSGFTTDQGAEHDRI